MNIQVFIRLTRYITTYHFLLCFVVFLVEVNGVSGRSELRTKLLLQNIRTHLAQKVDEIVEQKECESGLKLCKPLKSKDAEEEEKSEEIPPPPKIARGHHKPVFKVNPKDVIQTMMPKVHRSFFKKGNKNERQYSEDINIPEKEVENISDENEIISSKKEKSTIKSFEKLKTPTTKPFVRFRDKNVPFDKPEKPIRKPIITIKQTEVTMKAPQVKESKQEMKTKLNYDSENQKNNIEQNVPVEKTLKEKTVEAKERKNTKLKVQEEKKKKEDEEKSEDFLLSGGNSFFMDSDQIKNDLCRKHSEVYLNQLKKYKIWALMMYDASAKLPSGILQGNVNQFGDFDECLSINAVFKKGKSRPSEPSAIKGKYCLANVDVSTNVDTKGLTLALERAQSFSFISSSISDPGHFIPRFSTINWGVCVPSSCSAEDVELFLETLVKKYNETSGIIFKIQVEEENCDVKHNLELEWTAIATLFFYLAIISISIYATHIDHLDKRIEDMKSEKTEVSEENYSIKDKMLQLALAFSLKRSFRKLFSETENRNCIQCINGIKTIFTLMLYFAHKTIPLGMTPFTNRLFLTKISNEPSTVLLRSSIVYTDSFLLISGVLISYNLSRELSQKGRISWVKKCLGRFIRLTPALLAVLLFYAYIWDSIGSGPLWNLIVKKNSQLCQQHMWRNLLYIQNFFAFEDMCAPQTHQLALDMQMSLLAPLFANVLFKYDKVGIGILQALFLVSSIMRYISTTTNELSVVIYHGMPVSQLYKTADYLYGQSLHRASPYILGTIVGYYLKKFENQIDMSKAFVALGWIVAFALGFYSIAFPSHLAYRKYKYDVQEAAQYAALSPMAWSLSLSWVIVACHLGYGGKVNEFLCQKLLLIFSKISYSIYLTQFLVFFYKIGVKRIPEMFTFAGSFNVTEFFIVISISTVITLLFDIPMMEIKSIALSEKSKKPNKECQEKEIEPEESEIDSQVEEFSVEQDVHEDLEEKTDSFEKDISVDEEYALKEEEEEEREDEQEEEGEEGDIDGEEIEQEDEDFDLQPLRRSTRIDFEEEPDDSEWFKVEKYKEEKEEEEELL